jgi:hypothetical protein
MNASVFRVTLGIHYLKQVASQMTCAGLIPRYAYITVRVRIAVRCRRTGRIPILMLVDPNNNVGKTGLTVCQKRIVQCVVVRHTVADEVKTVWNRISVADLALKMKPFVSTERHVPYAATTNIIG